MASDICPLEGGHDSLYEYQCSLCEEEGHHVQATKFCKECFVYMCDSCVQTKHNKFPLNKRHQMLEQTQFSTVKSSSLRSFPTKRCPKHPGELINIYCGEHDVVCCIVCKTLEHSYCDKSQHLLDAAKGINIKSKDCQSIIQETKTLLSDVEKILNEGKAEIKRIIEANDQLKTKIADFRKRVDKYFDDLITNCLDELKELESNSIGEIERDVESLDGIRAEAEEILRKMQMFNGENECDLFVHVKDGNRLLKDAKGSILNVSRSVRKESIDYEVDPKIDEFLKSLETLGSFTDKSVTITRHPETITNADTVQPLQTEKCDGYGNADSICDMCVLADGTIVILWEKCLIQAFDRLNQYMDDLQIGGTPVSICATGDGRVAVLSNERVVTGRLKEASHTSMRRATRVVVKSVKGVVKLDKGDIWSVTVGKKLIMFKTFHIKSLCSGMIYDNGMLYVCVMKSKSATDSFRIAVYSEGGQLQSHIPHSSVYFRAAPRHMIVSDGGQLLLTYFRKDNISLLDISGNVVSSFDSISLKPRLGICTDRRGHLFVCTDRNEVVQLSHRHQKREVILGEKDGIKDPRAIYFDIHKSRLFVLCCESDREADILKYTHTLHAFNLTELTLSV